MNFGLDHDSGHCRGGLYALPFRAGINPAPKRQRFSKNGRNDDQLVYSNQPEIFPNQYQFFLAMHSNEPPKGKFIFRVIRICSIRFILLKIELMAGLVSRSFEGSGVFFKREVSIIGKRSVMKDVIRIILKPAFLILARSSFLEYRRLWQAISS